MTIKQVSPGNNQKVIINEGDYQVVAASQTAKPLGANGGQVGDFLTRLIILPATLAAGSISLLDGATSTPIFVSGTLSNLAPITIEIGARSVNGAWSLTTGANVSVLAVGNFT